MDSTLMTLLTPPRNSASIHLAATPPSPRCNCSKPWIPSKVLRPCGFLMPSLLAAPPLRYDDRRAAKELGITAVTTYGSSETAGGCVYNGRPLPGVTVRVVGERIILGGPMIAAGYRNLPDHEDFQPEGFFKTSDTGYLKDGILTVTGRLDTVIVSGGLKIHPEVLEEVIREIPGIYDVCVVGVPDRRLGQAIAAVYTGTATAEDIIESLHELPRWQLPKDIMKVEMLPLTGPGKVDRSAIMQLFV